MQFSMARKFKYRQLRRYSVKPSKMCINMFTLPPHGNLRIYYVLYFYVLYFYATPRTSLRAICTKPAQHNFPLQRFLTVYLQKTVHHRSSLLTGCRVHVHTGDSNSRPPDHWATDMIQSESQQSSLQTCMTRSRRGHQYRKFYLTGLLCYQGIQTQILQITELGTLTKGLASRILV